MANLAGETTVGIGIDAALVGPSLQRGLNWLASQAGFG
jgi:hypothetical protein